MLLIIILAPSRRECKDFLKSQPFVLSKNLVVGDIIIIRKRSDTFGCSEFYGKDFKAVLKNKKLSILGDSISTYKVERALLDNCKKNLCQTL